MHTLESESANKNQRDIVVVKFGSNVVVNSGFREQIMQHNIAQIAEVHREKSVVIVTSGAGAMGRVKGNGRKSNKRADAAVGQVYLMNEYLKLCDAHGLTTAQVMLEKHWLEREEFRADFQEFLEDLIAYNVIPIINENDPVATPKNHINNNDLVALEVTMMLRAHMMLLLTAGDGIMDEHGALITDVWQRSDWEPHIHDELTEDGTGGMWPKGDAAQRASDDNVAAAIANGLSVTDKLIRKFSFGERIRATIFHPRG